MIDETTLDCLIPVPTEEELLKQVRSDLTEAGFKITKWDSGGVFYILTRVVIRCHIELLQLARTVLNNSFVRHAAGKWLELKGQDYSKVRKAATKTQGYVTITRSSATDQLMIPKGHMFKTLRDANGDELKYYVLADTIIPEENLSGMVLVEAQKAGTDYNVPQDRITVSMVYINGVVSVTNTKDWIQVEGSDEESDESFQARCLASWSDLAANTTRQKLQLAVESIPGVLTAYIDDDHPRGQGTVDIIVTGSAGAATEELLVKVQAAADLLKDNYEDYLVKSAEVVYQDLEITIYLAKDASTESVREQAEGLLSNLMQLSGRTLNVLLQEDITYVLKKNITSYKKTVFITPDTDVILPVDKVLLLGKMSINVTNMVS